MAMPTWGFGLTASLAAAILVVDGLAGQRVHADLRHTHWRLLHVAMETQNLSSVCRVLHHLDTGRSTLRHGFKKTLQIKKLNVNQLPQHTLIYPSPARFLIILYYCFLNKYTTGLIRWIPSVSTSNSCYARCLHLLYNSSICQSLTRAMSKQHGTNNMSSADRQDGQIVSLSLLSWYWSSSAWDILYYTEVCWQRFTDWLQADGYL